jgi:hypothetical protein
MNQRRVRDPPGRCAFACLSDSSRIRLLDCLQSTASVPGAFQVWLSLRDRRFRSRPFLAWFKSFLAKTWKPRTARLLLPPHDLRVLSARRLADRILALSETLAAMRVRELGGGGAWTRADGEDRTPQVGGLLGAARMCGQSKSIVWKSAWSDADRQVPRRRREILSGCRQSRHLMGEDQPEQRSQKARVGDRARCDGSR